MSKHIGQYHFGWKMPLPGQRPRLSLSDHPHLKSGIINPSSDLRSKMPKIWNQKDLGSCTAFAALRLFIAQCMAQGMEEWLPSFLAQYYWTRQLEGTQDEDSGASVLDAIRTLKLRGVAPDSDWTYDTSKFAEAPPQQVSIDARDHVDLDDYGVSGLDEIRTALSAGKPVDLGATVFASIMDVNASNPVIPMPRTWWIFRDKPVGGHSFVLTGHDDSSRMFWMDNSWDVIWGLEGRAQISYDYIEQFADDAHIVDKVS